MVSTWNRRVAASAVLAVALTGVMLDAATVAHAEDVLTGQEAFSAVQAAQPSIIEDAASGTASDLDAAVADTNEGVSVEVARDASDGVRLNSSSSDSEVTIGLPEADGAGDAERVSAGVVVFDNRDGSSTVPVVRKDGSVQIFTVIGDRSAPTSYSYDIDVPGDGRLVMNAEGAVSVEDAQGAWVAGVMPAWAKDSSGASVPTRFVIDGTTLTQVVDLSDPSIAYPVVADPWLGQDTISSTQWSYAVKNDPRLLVYPTAWGRVWSGVAVWDEQWGEVIADVWTHLDWAKTNEMKWQFQCHLALGANLWKGSYNLDTKARRGSLLGYELNKCN